MGHGQFQIGHGQFQMGHGQFQINHGQFQTGGFQMEILTSITIGLTITSVIVVIGIWIKHEDGE